MTKDRAGNAYVAVRDEKGFVIGFVSPARQAKKARGLSGRQEVRWRKAQRRPVAVGFDGARLADYTPRPAA